MNNPGYGQGDVAVQAPYGSEDVSYFHADDGEAVDDYRTVGPSRFMMILHGAGALLSVGLIAGGVWWGYNQIMRDVNGVPVVRALEGPIRIAPEDPGGRVANHEGLSVNDVQAVGVAANPEDRLTLAPAPVALAEEDKPIPALRPEPRPASVTAPQSPGAEAADAELVAVDETVPQVASLNMAVPADDPMPQARQVADALIAGATPLATDESEPALVSPEAADVAKLPGIKRSIRPAKRPANVVLASAPATARLATADSSVVAPGLVDAIDRAVRESLAPGSPDVPSGTRLVQLGSYDTPEAAAAAWNGIRGKFGDLMSDKQQVIVQAQAAGKDFWRLRAMGFNGLPDARRFCAALVAEQTDCIPVVAR